MRVIGNSTKCKARESCITNLTVSPMRDSGTMTSSQAGALSTTNFLSHLLDASTIATSTKSKNTGSNMKVKNT
jgi:hypothetical protein